MMEFKKLLLEKRLEKIEDLKVEILSIDRKAQIDRLGNEKLMEYAYEQFHDLINPSGHEHLTFIAQIELLDELLEDFK